MSSPRHTCAAVLLAFLLIGCLHPNLDSTQDQAAMPDAAAADGGDAQPDDAAAQDVPVDVDVPDDVGAPLDAAEQDAELPDAEAPDAELPDAELPDAETPRCEPLPVTDCAAAEVTTEEHFMRAAPGCAFALELRGDPADQLALADAVVAQAGGAVGIEGPLGDLNRVATSGVTDQTAQRLRNHSYRGFRWNDGDMETLTWYPQGITGSSDAAESGRVNDQEVLLVSWYDHTEDRPTRGVRLSVVDVTALGEARYRHLLLVEPTGTPEAPSFRAVQTGSGAPLHAGGIVWYGDRLYVADTTQGLRVFDLSRTFRVANTDDTARIGFSAGRVDARGYRYAAPEIARYGLAGGSCDLRFSFVSLDRSTDPPSLLTGEYRQSDTGGRLVRWALQSDGSLALEQGQARASEAVIGGQTKMQGALSSGGRYWMSSSSQYASFGRLYRNAPNGQESHISAWVYGCEDLTLLRQQDEVWTPAEHPGARDVVGIPLPR